MLSIKDLKWSEHATKDRQQRTLDILMTVGFGEIIKVRQDYTSDRLRAFTSTGCILIICPQNMTIITAFLSSIDQMTEFFNGHAPVDIRKTVKHSIKIYQNHLARK